MIFLSFSLSRCKERDIHSRVYTAEISESVGRTVCNLVKEHSPTCVVIGQRGLGVVKRQIYNSVSEFVLHHAHVPVIIVPPPKE